MHNFKPGSKIALLAKWAEVRPMPLKAVSQIKGSTLL